MAQKKLDNKNLSKVLESQGGKAVALLVKILTEADKKATGALIKSLDYEVIDTLHGLTLKILASDHFKYVDRGRKAGSTPPPVRPILSWVRTRHIVFNGLSSKQTAFIIARSIGEKGIKPTYAKDKVNKMLQKNLSEIIKGAVGKDIQELINHMDWGTN